MSQRYEQLREAAAGGENAFRLGLGVLATHGMAAWIGVWNTFIPPTPPAPVGPAAPGPGRTGADEVVRVLAAMTLAGLSGPAAAHRGERYARVGRESHPRAPAA